MSYPLSINVSALPLPSIGIDHALVHRSYSMQPSTNSPNPHTQGRMLSFTVAVLHFSTLSNSLHSPEANEQGFFVPFFFPECTHERDWQYNHYPSSLSCLIAIMFSSLYDNKLWIESKFAQQYMLTPKHLETIISHTQCSEIRKSTKEKHRIHRTRSIYVCSDFISTKNNVDQISIHMWSSLTEYHFHIYVLTG